MCVLPQQNSRAIADTEHALKHIIQLLDSDAVVDGMLVSRYVCVCVCVLVCVRAYNARALKLVMHHLMRGTRAPTRSSRARTQQLQQTSKEPKYAAVDMHQLIWQYVRGRWHM